MKKRFEAFSLAEALITLTIISLILAAVLPVISKRQNTSDSMWHYISSGTGASSSIFYGLGSAQTAIIGSDKDPSAAPATTRSRLTIVTPMDNKDITMGVGSPDTINRSIVGFYQSKTPTTTVPIGKLSFDQYNNVALGLSALSSNTTGANSVAVGSSALNANTTASWNTAIGTAAMSVNTGAENTAVGGNAMASNTVGKYNTAVGVAALSAVAGDSNTAVGRAALQLATGANNTALGHTACSSVTSGASNVCIGVSATTAAATDSNKLVIESNTGSYNGTTALIYGDFSARTIKVSGNISAAASGASLGDITAAHWLYSADGIAHVSDARLKNIGKDNNVGLDKILKLKIKSFTMKNDKTHRPRIGVIAQELQKVMPTAVVKNSTNGYFYIDDSEILYTMVNAVKQLYQKIVDVTTRVEALEKENNILKNKIEKQGQLLKVLDSRIKKLEAKK